MDWDLGQSASPAVSTRFPARPGTREFWEKKQEALIVSIKEDFELLVERMEDQLAKLAEPERIE